MAIAPGIPQREYGDPTTGLRSGQRVTYSLQKHDTARRPGRPHLDLRLGTPRTRLYSWAVPKGELPAPGKRRLAPQSFLHDFDYGKFKGRIKEKYGRGTVKLQDYGQAQITKVTPKSIHFTLSHKRVPTRYVLIRMEESDKGQPNWLLLAKPAPDSPYVGQKPRIAPLNADTVDEALQQATAVQEKIDGAHGIFDIDEKGRMEAYSIRRRNTGEPIVHTERLGLSGVKLPELRNTTFRGEIYGEDPKGQMIPFTQLSGLLNANLDKSLTEQQERKIKLKAMLFDVVRYKGRETEADDYPNRRTQLEEAAKALPQDRFQVSQAETRLANKRQLLEAIRAGKHPRTTEGVILHMPDNRMAKYKVRPDVTVRFTGTYPGTGKRQSTAGGLTFETAEGVPGRVGTGFTDMQLADIVGRINELKGTPMRLGHRGQTAAGKLREPSFQGFETDKNAQHIMLTGTPAAGKTTLAEQLGEETGMPVLHLDKLPARKGNTFSDTEDARNAIKKLRAAHVIEGAHILGFGPADLEGHDVRLLTARKKALRDRLIQRGWTDEGGIARKGQQDRDKAKQLVREFADIVKRFKQRNPGGYTRVKSTPEADVPKHIKDDVWPKDAAAKSFQKALDASDIPGDIYFYTDGKNRCTACFGDWHETEDWDKATALAKKHFSEWEDPDDSEIGKPEWATKTYSSKNTYKEAATKKDSGWIGVDFDGTLAHYEGWNGGELGEPIPAMVKRVKKWLKDGKKVKVFTARAHNDKGGAQAKKIKAWCKEHIGKELEVTNVKDHLMKELWDDRAVQVKKNKGEQVKEATLGTLMSRKYLPTFRKLTAGQLMRLRKYKLGRPAARIISQNPDVAGAYALGALIPVPAPTGTGSAAAYYTLKKGLQGLKGVIKKTGAAPLMLKEAIIKQENGRFVLYSHKGKVLGRHPSKEKALAQEHAIQASKHASVNLMVTSPEGEKRAELHAEIADTPEKRATGLSKYSSLPAGRGMFFDTAGSYWMKGVDYPLDLVYLNKQGEILEVTRMEPQTRKIYSAQSDKAAHALEVPADWLAEQGIKIGDRIVVAETGQQ